MKYLRKLMGFVYKSVSRYFFVLLVAFLVSCAEKKPAKPAGLQKEYYDSVLNVAHSMADTGYKHSFDRVFLYLDSIAAICQQNNNEIGLVQLDYIKGSMYRLNYQYTNAVKYCEMAYARAKGKDLKLETNLLLEIGDIYRSINKKKLANEYYLVAYESAYKTKDTELQAFVSSRLGSIFYLQQNYALAINAYQQSLSVVKKTAFEGEHRTKELQLYNNLALCHVKLKNYDTAGKYYDSALEAGNKLDSSVKVIATGVVRGNLGRLLQLQGKYNEAIPLLISNIAINALPKNDNADAITSYTYLLEIYAHLDSLGAFEENMEKAMTLLKTIKRGDMKQWEARLTGLRADFFAKKGNYKAAFESKKRQLLIQDTIAMNAEIESLDDMILYRQLNEQGAKMALLEKDSRLQKSKLTMYLSIAILGVVLLIAASVGLNYYRKSLKGQQQLNKQIALQNTEITLNKTELEQAIEELKLLDGEKNRLLGMVAHDLRGPIYNISGVVALIESSANYDKMDDTDTQLIELIKKSCENALEVINDLLEAAKLDATGAEITRTPENLGSLIETAIGLYKNQAQQKGIKIVFSPPKEGIIAVVNKEKISRVFGNLLSNAIKFSHKDSDVNIVLTNTPTSALISIADKGVGIPDKYKGAIFDKFTRAKRTGTAGEKPVGLGMSIVKQIVEAHNGRLWFESEVNQGTTFFIELPMA